MSPTRLTWGPPYDYAYSGALYIHLNLANFTNVSFSGDSINEKERERKVKLQCIYSKSCRGSGKGYPKVRIQSSFFLPQVIINLYPSLSSVEHRRRYFEKCLRVFFIHTIEVNGVQCFSSEYLLCVLRKKKSNRSAMTWSWINDRSLIFWFLTTVTLSVFYTALRTNEKQAS